MLTASTWKHFKLVWSWFSCFYKQRDCMRWDYLRPFIKKTNKTYRNSGYSLCRLYASWVLWSARGVWWQAEFCIIKVLKTVSSCWRDVFIYKTALHFIHLVLTSCMFTSCHYCADISCKLWYVSICSCSEVLPLYQIHTHLSWHVRYVVCHCKVAVQQHLYNSCDCKILP